MTKISALRKPNGNIAEFAPALAIILTVFVACVSLSELLLLKLVAQTACTDAAKAAAACINQQEGAGIVQQRALQLSNSGLQYVAGESGPTWFTMTLGYNANCHNATVLSCCTVKPFGLPVAVQLRSLASCPIEHLEGW